MTRRNAFLSGVSILLLAAGCGKAEPEAKVYRVQSSGMTDVIPLANGCAYITSANSRDGAIFLLVGSKAFRVKGLDSPSVRIPEDIYALADGSAYLLKSGKLFLLRGAVATVLTEVPHLSSIGTKIYPTSDGGAYLTTENDGVLSVLYLRGSEAFAVEGTPQRVIQMYTKIYTMANGTAYLNVHLGEGDRLYCLEGWKATPVQGLTEKSQVLWVYPLADGASVVSGGSFSSSLVYRVVGERAVMIKDTPSAYASSEAALPLGFAWSQYQRMAEELWQAQLAVEARDEVIRSR